MISTSNAWNHDSLLARTQARLTTYCAGLCFKSLASKFFFFFYGEQVPSLNPKDSSFVTVTKTKGRYQSFALVCLMTRYLINETGIPTIISYCEDICDKVFNAAPQQQG